MSAPQETDPQPPPSFSFDHSRQRLAAGRATEPPGSVGVRTSKMLFAPGTIAAEKSGFRCWALALARLLSAVAGRIRR